MLKRLTLRGSNRKFVSILLVFFLAVGSPAGMVQNANGQKRKTDQPPSRSNDTKKLKRNKLGLQLVKHKKIKIDFIIIYLKLIIIQSFNITSGISYFVSVIS